MVKHTIYTAPTRYNVNWRCEPMTWEEFAGRCARPVVTPETAAEFASLPSDRRCAIKDVGGFVGGSLKGGRRRSGSVDSRSLITLDYDHAPALPMEQQPVVLALRDAPFAGLVYTTHSHSEATPRFRVVIPLAHALEPAAYAEAARAAAAMIGTEGIDSTTFEPERMFFWPSHSCDAPFFYRLFEGCEFDLRRHRQPIAVPPEPVRAAPLPLYPLPDETAPDPRKKGGIVGAFCRAFSISEAIEAFLPTVYSRCGASRYTYTSGSTVGGLVVYNDLWADSHHDTDPAGGHVVNAYDLVRCHLFGGGPQCHDKAILNRMEAFARRQLKGDGLIGDSDDCGAATYPNTIEGARSAILDLLADKVWFNSFSRSIIVKGGLPWRNDAVAWQDRDYDGLCWFLEQYGIKSDGAIAKGFSAALFARSHHPVAEYLNSIANLEYTPGELERLFIDYLGADDTEYTRTVTRKFFVAAVARIFNPGCKFDYCPVLQGPQGIGKSTLLAVMGGEWFSDSLTTLEGKEPMEQLRGKWLIELGEFSAVRRSDIQAVKTFVSRRVDNYRAAYGRMTEDWPRQCVMAGTTNENLYLQGDSNRRFLPIVTGGERTRSVFDDLPRRRDFLWAEAYALYRDGETLFLDPQTERTALQYQNRANVEADNPFMGELEVYLDRQVPVEWDSWDANRRRSYMVTNPPPVYSPLKQRDRVSPREFLFERYGISPDSPYYRKKAAEVAAAFKRLGWVEVRCSRHCLNAYGRQKSFDRPGQVEDYAAA